jgi:aminoglycoside/choline kinase family phosphotransferase
MATDSHEELLSRFFKQLTGQQPSSITPLRPHASERRIFRLSTASKHMIGVHNPIRRENDTFVAFARHFKSRGLPVPEIYHYEPDANLYLEEDLGDETLFDLLASERTKTSTEEFPQSAEALYRASFEFLPRFQIESATSLDFSLCYPERDLLPGTFAGDCAAFSTDLVLKLAPTFDISRLTPDFAALMAFLEQAEARFFVYRDFQSRNIMHYKGLPYFIDFQSGRRGPLQYDVVSLLYQSSTKVPQHVRERLVQHYISVASRYTQIDAELYYRFFSGFIIARMLQVLGVYGRQGLGAGKTYFIESIPAAVSTLQLELHKPELPLTLHALRRCADELSKSLLRRTTP